RIPLWEECAGQLAERPWLGFGYKSFWTPQRILKISHHQGWSIMQAHNGYLEMALNVGLIGAGLFIAIIVLSIKHALALFAETKSVGAAYAVAVLSWLVLNTLLESWIDEPLLPSFVSLTLIVSLACLEQPLWQRNDLKQIADGQERIPAKLTVSTPRLSRPSLVN
ncbi:MAG: O-antigen ligase family protein, partial [Lacipirellulaceae bacterium]